MAHHVHSRWDGDNGHDTPVSCISCQFVESITERREYDKVMMKQFVTRGTITAVGGWMQADLYSCQQLQTKMCIFITVNTLWHCAKRAVVITMRRYGHVRVQQWWLTAQQNFRRPWPNCDFARAHPKVSRQPPHQPVCAVYCSWALILLLNKWMSEWMERHTHDTKDTKLNRRHRIGHC